jgi:hypothetical protein
VIAPDVVHFPKATGISMVPVAINFDVDFSPCRIEPCQVEPPPRDLKLWHALNVHGREGIE